MTPKQKRAIELWLVGHSDTEIARELRVRRETVWRWKNTADVAHALDRAVDGRLEASMYRIEGLVPAALDALAEALRRRKGEAATRVRAAAEVLNRAGWGGERGARGRVEAYVQHQLDAMFDKLHEALPAAVYAQVIDALAAPLPKPEAHTEEQKKAAAQYELVTIRLAVKRVAGIAGADSNATGGDESEAAEA